MLLVSRQITLPSLNLSGVFVQLSEKIEQKRISMHLLRVELKLRLRDVSHLSRKLQAERLKNIECLRLYRLAGVFPKNLDFPGMRVPYFKDAVGTPCAVAHLMEHSGWQGTVNSVRDNDNHVYVMSVSGGPVMEWIDQSGLTQEEAALVQPTYGGGGFDFLALLILLAIIFTGFVLPNLILRLQKLQVIPTLKGVKLFFAGVSVLALNVFLVFFSTTRLGQSFNPSPDFVHLLLVCIWVVIIISGLWVILYGLCRLFLRIFKKKHSPRLFFTTARAVSLLIILPLFYINLLFT